MEGCMMLKYTLIAGSAAILGACTTTDATGPAMATGAGAGALVGGPVGAVIGGAVGAGAAQAAPAQRNADQRRLYDARSGRYYYQDKATGRYFYENGDPYP